jgi:hypothetical protein
MREAGSEKVPDTFFCPFSALTELTADYAHSHGVAGK